MNPLRYSRISIHNKQDALHLKHGKPKIRELSEGVPVLRKTENGIEQYVRVNNVLYKSTFEKA